MLISFGASTLGAFRAHSSKKGDSGQSILACGRVGDSRAVHVWPSGWKAGYRRVNVSIGTLDKVE